MAREALRIVRRTLADDIMVRIVTRKAADAAIGAVETSAVRQTIGLESYVHFASPATPDYQFPGAMTLAAIVGDSFR